MAVSDWRKREIALALKTKESARGYLDKLKNTVDSLYEGNENKLGKQVKKLHDILTCFMAGLPADMNDMWTEAKELRERVVHVKPTAHRQREFGFGSLSLEVEEETDYMIGEEQDGMKFSSRKLTEEERNIYFEGQTLADKKIIEPNADKETDTDEVKVFFPGLEYDEDGNLKEDVE